MPCVEELTQDIAERSLEPILWFKHNANDHDSHGIRVIEKHYGPAGYGMWWHLCEQLASERGHSIPFASEDDYEILADALGCKDSKKCVSFISELATQGLIDPESLGEGKIMSERISEAATDVARKSVYGSKGGKSAGRGRPKTDTPD